MSDIAIRVENLSKQYKIGMRRHDRLKDLLASGLNGLFRRARSPVPGPPSSDGPNSKSQIRNSQSDFIWALKDVSFEVKRGETLGIIGSNGAGKSTLLKILSRITEPTVGRAEIFGRVGSLLEVGTGFDRELTGRENVYLNGAVLGMTKREIDRKFHEIVDFSGVEKFIDTPVKRYSSGMYVRLAFAVAAHLEAEIMIVDEVLAVGDAAFQKKCLAKIEGVAKGGRTVLFVSHNMSAILRLCPEAILLDKGEVVSHGRSTELFERYLDSGNQSGAEKVWIPEELPSTCGPFRPIAARVCNGSGQTTNVVPSSQPFSIEIKYQLTEPIRDIRVQLKLYSTEGTHLFSSSDTDDPVRHQHYYIRELGHYISRCEIPANLLNAGVFVVGFSVAVSNVYRYFWAHDCLRLTVEATSGVGTQWAEARGGFFRPVLNWEIQRL